jgi:hypothetical protein
MPPLRGFYPLVCAVPTACAVGYQYIAPSGLWVDIVRAYIELKLFTIHDSLFTTPHPPAFILPSCFC